jgi:hypothetical protein
MLWLIERSIKSVEVWANRMLRICGSFDANVDVANLLV